MVVLRRLCHFDGVDCPALTAPRCDVVKLVNSDSVGCGDCGLEDFPEGASSPLCRKDGGPELLAIPTIRVRGNSNRGPSGGIQMGPTRQVGANSGRKGGRDLGERGWVYEDLRNVAAGDDAPRRIFRCILAAKIA